jgi:excisionase family DNA binding protein
MKRNMKAIEQTGEREQLVADGSVVVGEAVRFTSLGRTTLYGLMERGELRYIKVGRRRLIPRAELKRLLAGGLMEGAGQ